MPEIKPGIGVLNTFKNQKTEIQFALGEYVDNSVDSYFKNKEELENLDPDYKPHVDIAFDPYENTIVIEDNCAGIHKEDEERAFMIGTQNPNQQDIGTYGMGMKVSSFWFCPNWEVETKPLNENFKKTYQINLDEILENGKTKDSKIKSDADPFTKITLKNVYKGKVPSDTRALNNIQNYLADMYRFMILEQSITIRFNGIPLNYVEPIIFKERYFSEKDGEKILWVSKVPEFYLGKVKLGNETVELKTEGGVVYIKEKGTNKGQKGFSFFWKNRLVDGHPQRPWRPGNNYDDPDLKIYGASNQYVAQRLEGYIHISPSFQVPSTKDGIRWEGFEEVFIKKLKNYLENATIFNDESGKTYDFIRQCKKIAHINEEDKLREEQEKEEIKTDEEILNEIEKEKEINIPKEPEDELLDEGEDIFDGNAKQYSLQYENTKWTVEIKTVNKNHEKFYKIVNGPFGKPGDLERNVGLKINLGHPFIRYHFSQQDIDEQREGIIKFCISLALGEAITAEKPGKQVRQVRLISNEIIDKWGDNY